jgi:excisionase family DNA binding protein
MCINPSDLPLALSVDQAAKLLNISRNLTYEMVRQGRIPSIRLGRIIRVPRSRLKELLEDQELPSLHDEERA